jgi:hypothetical protein
MHSQPQILFPLNSTHPNQSLNRPTQYGQDFAQSTRLTKNWAYLRLEKAFNKTSKHKQCLEKIFK